MMTIRQIEDLSVSLQIDKLTVFREYLQLLFLNALSGEKEAENIFFKGGTAIHLLFGSFRFSEDLDFTTGYQPKKIKTILAGVEKKLQKELPEIKILPLYGGKNGLRLRLKYEGKIFKYPLVIRLDFSYEKVFQPVVSPLITKFPLGIFPVVSHLSEKEILAEKIRALLVRGKGRDFFDLWYLLAKGTPVDKKILARKFKVVGKKFSKAGLLAKIQKYPQKNLALDLNKFLPAGQRRIINLLKKELIRQLKI